MRSLLWWCTFLAVLVSTQASAKSAGMSDAAAEYLNHALDLLQQHALHRDEIDWHQLRRAAYSYAANAQTPADTYPAIVYACTQLCDHSSHLEEPSGTPLTVQQKSEAVRETAEAGAHRRKLTSAPPSPFPSLQSPVFATVSSNHRHYAYIIVPQAGRAKREKWAADMIALIRRGADANGWIIDLRGNRGGYLEPMLSGMQPFFADGTLLTLRGPDADESWFIKDRRLSHRWPSGTEAEPVDPASRPNHQTSPVVILLDRATASAAESLAIAFKGRPATWFIGERTAGLTTMGFYWRLSDGAVLSIMSQQVYDRDGSAYPEGVPPDEAVEDPRTSGMPIAQDPAVIAAQAWLDKQP